MLTRIKVAIIRRMARKRLGRDIAPLKTMATHPGVLVASAQYSVAIDKTNLVSARLKKLAQIRAAKLVECPF
jgi:hypothetical protein